MKRSGLESWWWELTSVVLSVGGALLVPVKVTVWLQQYLVADRTAVYAALIGLQSALLGFVLAALTIVLGYSQSPRLRVLRKGGQLPNLFNVYLAGTRSHALATLISLLALVVNGGYEVTTVLCWMVALSFLVTALRLARTLWVTKNVVEAVSADAARKAGAL